MNRKTKTIIVSAIAIPIALTSAASAAAMEPLFAGKQTNNKPRIESRYRGVKSGIKLGEELKDVIERGDYAAFQTLVQGLPEDAPMRNFTEEQFTKLGEMHRLFVAGNKDDAKVIAEELNLERPRHEGKRNKHAKHVFRKELRSLDADAREAARMAWEANSYSAFRAAIGDELLPDMTEEIFTLKQDMQAAHKAGDRDEVKRIREALKALRK